MTMRVQGRLLMTSATLTNNDQRLTLNDVVVDTGSVTTVFATHKLAAIGITPLPHDAFHRITGIGGWEYVLDKRLQALTAGGMSVSGFGIEIGSLDYGFVLDGILGLGFLLAVKAVVDLDRMELRPGQG